MSSLLRRLRTTPFRDMVRGRLTLNLRPLAPPSDRPRVLVHGVSVGEVKAAKSLGISERTLYRKIREYGL